MYSKDFTVPSSSIHVYERVHEPIDVRIETKNGKIFVREFDWHKQTYFVGQQSLVNKAMKGVSPVWFFSVVTAEGSFQLRWDCDQLLWYLEMVMSRSSE